MRFHVATLACLAFLGQPCPAAAQAPASRGTPTAPIAPAFLAGDPGAAANAILRSADGRLQVEATAALAAVRVDGALDDEVWRRAQPVSGFVQSEPHEGRSATEATEVRVAYDAQYLYVSAYCRDSAPDKLVVNSIRKDFKAGEQDSFDLILDPFADRRNGFVFSTNPEGAKSDTQIANEGRESNPSWDAIWLVKTSRVADGWTVEMAIPFSSLRFEAGSRRSWGINFSRRIRRKNEIAYWAPVPRAYGLSRVSLAGDLIGLPALGRSVNLRVKPSIMLKGERPTGGARFDRTADLGLDVKIGVTPSLTLDVTARPDFAQAEADEQQVNLTQFSQFFPEKRDFFLENSGTFYVGDAQSRSNPTLTPDEDLLPFSSRRIGLTPGGQPVPLLAGARLTGSAFGLGVGALTVQADATASTPATNFSVLRLRKNVLARSDVGAIVMNRQSAGGLDASYNRVWGLDANIRPFSRVDWNSYVLQSAAPGVTGGQVAYRSTASYEGNFFHGKGGVMSLGENFTNDLGYYRRTGVRKWIADVGIRPRPAALQRRGIREVHPNFQWYYFTDQAGRPVAKQYHNGLTFFFNRGGYVEVSSNPQFQAITTPFRIHRGDPPIPAGEYAWTQHELRLKTNSSRALSFSMLGTVGGLWTGTQRSLSTTVAFQPSYRFRLTASMQRTAAHLNLPRIDFVTTLWTIRANYSFDTNMYLDSLVQYDRDRRVFNANVRFNLVHRPLSDLFVVFNDQRIITPAALPAGRGVIVKYTQLLAF